MIAFSACNKEGDYASYAEFATVKVLPGNDFYFEIDGQQKNSTLYPGDRSRIGGFVAQDGRRVIVEFNILDEKKESYDFNGAIYNVREIYTGTSKIIETQEQLDALKDDPIEFQAAQSTRKYLSVRVAYPISNPTKHEFVLIRNNVTAADETAANYYNVELRHDAGGDLYGDKYRNYLSFDLEPLFATGELDGMKGLLIRIKSPSGSSQYYKVSLPQQE